ncbi:hypothetical protein BVRB_3g063960 [Beta vulgaris subsp. vulgaris]|nr:hypothetical protein BVRB_3g063960 [Beta vulgaris subsp. vulgaris]
MALEFVTGMFASVVVQEFIDTIKSFGCDQFRHVIADVEKKLQALEMSYVKAQSMLDKVDGWEFISGKLHREWVGDVKRACYDIEDLIADVVGEMRKTQNDLSFLKNWIVSREIDEQQQNLDALLEKASNLVTLHSMEHPRSTVGSEPLTEFKPFKRESEKDEIITMLLRSTTFRSSGAASSSRSGRGTTGVIVSIEGMLGLGKTLLAHTIKNDIKIQQFFDQKFWVNLSGKFNLAEVLRSIMVQADMQEYQEKQQLEVKLKSFRDWCKGKRIFIVIDDLCNFLNLQDWEEFESLLLNSTLAFAILITTRNPKVTKSLTSISIVPVITHYLKGLSIEDCQSIILGDSESYITHTNNSKRRRHTQEQTALEIAERFCKGLPLVANVIKLHLYSEPEGRWSNILWHPGEPHHTAGSLEEMGNHLFDELLSRSIIVYENEAIVYKMHEYIHCYTQHVSSDLYMRIDEGFIDAHSSLSNGMPSSTVISRTWFSKPRHVSLVSRNITTSVLKDLEKCKGLRTLVTLLERVEIKELAYGLFSKLQSLRVLNLSATYIKELPGSIGNLKHLQLLDVSRTYVEDLPISISKLTRLQVLRLTGCYILELPKDMHKLTNLVHLELDKRLFCMPPHIGKLTKLQTLPEFIVGTEDGCRITELNNLKQLQGSICLTKLENVGDKDEAKKAMLGNKRFIKKLELGWIKDSNDTRLQAKGVLKRLEPHRDLEELKVIGYGGAKFPNWLSSPECKLTSIHLRRCYGCRSLPILGQIPYLKALHIQEMYMVRYVDDEFSGGTASNFPALELLILQDMENLANFQGKMIMPRLRDLRILGCPVLRALPYLNRLAALINLEIKDCAALQSLPDGIMPLSLKQLIIEDSDLLKQRCLQEGGADWCKISLVPRVVIDFVPIETLTSYTIHEVDHQ